MKKNIYAGLMLTFMINVLSAVRKIADSNFTNLKNEIKWKIK